MNNVCLTGRMTDNVELKQTPSGVSVCSFTLAVKRPNVKDTTDFINCVAWRGTAEFISRYFGKGKKIEVNGVLTSRKYEDKNKKKRVAYEVVCERVDFAESKTDDETPPASPPQFEPIDAESDLPF